MPARYTYLTVCLLIASAAFADDLVLVDTDASPPSRYRIVLAADATMQEGYAAELLQQYVKQMTGFELRIASDAVRPIDTEIVIGFNNRLDHLGVDLTRDELGPEEFVIKTVGSSLVIVGGSPRGAPYGVNSLLTDHFGCRWFTPQLRRIATYKKLTLGPTDRRYEPPFEWRNAFFWSGIDVDLAVA